MKEDKIPVVEYGVDDETGESFTMVANTKRPAIKSKGYAFSEADVALIRERIFMDDEKMIVIAPVIIPNVDMAARHDYIDLGDGKGVQYILHKPVFTEKGTEKMYKKFMKTLKTTYIFNNEHDNTVRPSYFFEIWRKEFATNDKANGYGLDHPVGTVYMMEQVEDPKYWEEIKKNGATGFSIQGLLGTKKHSFSDDAQYVKDFINGLNTEQLAALLTELL